MYGRECINHDHVNILIFRKVITIVMYVSFYAYSPAPSLAKSPSSGSSASGNTEDAAKQRVKVNDSAPTTNLQVRLADGSRLDILFMDIYLCFMFFFRNNCKNNFLRSFYSSMHLSSSLAG